MKITVAIIVRNEERCITRCILSVLPHTDELIIIDTGSTDSTISLIAGLPGEKIKLYKIPWNDSFAEVRNNAIERASGTHIFFIDADEYITSDLSYLSEAINENSASNDSPVFYIRIMDHDNNVTSVPRCFSVSGGFYYQGYVHEELRRKDGGNIKPVLVPLIVHHDGYRSDIFSQKHKSERNHTLNKKNLNDEPECIRWHFFYYRDGFEMIDHEEMIYKLLTIINLKGEPKLSLPLLRQNSFTFGILELLARAHLRLLNDPFMFNEIISIMNTLLPGNSNGFYYRKLYSLLLWKKECQQSLFEIISFKKLNSVVMDGSTLHSDGLHIDSLLGFYLYECGHEQKAVDLLMSVKCNGYTSGPMEKYLSLSSQYKEGV